MKTIKQTHRRNFLVAAGLGGAAAAAAVVTGARPLAAGTRKKDLAAAQPSGYHASEHIKKYYKTTEV